MPTLNEYKNSSGYFIRARPPEAGNITYQVSPIAETILEKLDLDDGDEVNWRTIQALKVPDLVYTGEQGVSESNGIDFASAKEDSVENLTSEQAQTLLEELRSQASLSETELEEINDVLGDRIGSRVSRLETTLQQAIKQAGQAGELSNLAVSDYEFTVDVTDLRDESENGLCNISLTGALDEPFNEPYQLGIFVCQEHGVEHWQCTGDFEQSWEFKSEMYRQIAELLPIIISELENVGIDPKSPEETPYPKISRWAFE